MQLTGKTILITGAASGIGRETARLLAREGARLVLLDRDAEALSAVCDELPSGAAFSAVVDVTRQGEVDRVVSDLWSLTGGIDIALNSAGILRVGTHDRTTTEDVAACMLVNFYGTVHLMQALIPRMKARGAGHIINMGSMAALRGMAHLGAYSASKFAVVGLSQTWRDELHGSGVTISVICPPIIRTPMVTGQATLPPIYNKFGWLTPQHVARTIRRAMDTRRFLVLVDLQSKALYWVDRLFPWLVDRLMLRWTL